MSDAEHWLPEAQQELIEAYEWYEDRQPGLGEALKEDIEQALKLALNYPDAFPEATFGIRYIRLNRFHEYAIYYEPFKNGLLIYAFFHSKRNPKGLAVRIGIPKKKGKKKPR